MNKHAIGGASSLVKTKRLLLPGVEDSIVPRRPNESDRRNTHLYCDFSKSDISDFDFYFASNCAPRGAGVCPNSHLLSQVTSTVRQQCSSNTNYSNGSHFAPQACSLLGLVARPILSYSYTMVASHFLNL